jgi:CheY-like chemotaxis protein
MKEERKILLVDDDPDLIRAMRTILESQNYRVIPARNGLEALDKVREEQPDLIILDLLMPELDGFGVCRELRENPEYSEHSQIPILILTAVREEASRRRYELETGRDLDVEDYIEKPVKPQLLLQRVAKLLDRSE